MKIYIMRHGEAGYHASSDAQRSLTEYGRKESEQAALNLKKQLNQFDLALVSPYYRAQQTFEAFSTVIPINRSETNDSLTPGGDVDIIAEKLLLLEENGTNSVLIVSHLPMVGYLVNRLCPKVSPPMFATATIACVSLSNDGVGTLEWIQSVH